MLLDPNKLLNKLHPDALRAVRKLGRSSSFDLRVRSGRRSCAEQYDLYGIGRRYNTGSPPVTFANGCRSWHVLGRAVDLDVLDPTTGSPLSGCEPYAALGAIWEEMGGVWGGRFSGFGSCGDAGHFEWHPGQKIEEACPVPTDCESVERSIDSEIAAARTLSGLGTGLVAFGLVLGGIGGAWYILRGRL